VGAGRRQWSSTRRLDTASALVSTLLNVGPGAGRYVFLLVAWNLYANDVRDEINRRAQAFGLDLGPSGTLVQPYPEGMREMAGEVIAKPVVARDSGEVRARAGADDSDLRPKRDDTPMRTTWRVPGRPPSERTPAMCGAPGPHGRPPTVDGEPALFGMSRTRCGMRAHPADRRPLGSHLGARRMEFANQEQGPLPLSPPGVGHPRADRDRTCRSAVPPLPGTLLCRERPRTVRGTF
jgi:hypothetical protein